MKKVLVPTDFSDNAWDALIYAIRLYDDIPTQFYILNTFYVGASQTSTVKHQSRKTKLYKYVKEESVTELNKIEKYLNENLLNDKHEYIILSKAGSLLTIVKQVIIAEHIDILIMGTTGASGVKEILMGSNTAKVIKNINLCPIIAVPEEFKYKEIKEIVFATDLKRHYSESDLRCLKELQLIHNFRIKLIHIKKEDILNSVQQKNKDFLIKYFEKDNIIYNDILSEHDSLAEAINEYALEQHVNLICMLKYDHNFLEMLTHEPVIKKISFHSNIPLLILPT